MAFPVQFLARLAIPSVIALFLLRGNDPQQTALYDKLQEESDKVLSGARGEGEGPTETYDYIVIGGGSAGSVVVNRISANPANKVLLLEAGGDPNPLSDVPYGLASLTESDMFLKYKSIPQTHSCVARGGVCQFWRGRALGGSGSVNGMIYSRCNAKDYDLWANFTGDPVWHSSSVIRAFKAIESYHGFYERENSPNHGSSGEIHIGKIDSTPGADVLLDALGEFGILPGDVNSFEFPYGVSKPDYNIKNGLRHSGFHAFIQPILSRPNLHIYRYATATKIHLDENTKRAVGVTYQRHGQERYVAASKEIILSAGAIDSPKLLLLSGIGPSAHLASLGIPTVLDLPVGDNLQDHVAIKFGDLVAVNKTFGIANPFAPANMLEYVTNGTGPFLIAEPSGEFIPRVLRGYFTSKTFNDPTWPDLQLSMYEQLKDSQEETFGHSLELLRSKQTGTLRLASVDPKDVPLIDPKFFVDDPTDIDRLAEGMETMVDIYFNSTVFKSLGVKWSRRAEELDVCREHPFASRAFWRCYIRLYSTTSFHPTSTCRMGPNSSVAVVDSHLRVFGASGLRVVDSSVMPFVPSGNTNFPSFMVGQMGARLILNQI